VIIMVEEVIIKSKGGTMTVEQNGFKGKACEKTLDALVRETGGRKTHIDNKPELYQKEAVAQKRRA
jgi:hypothetical protein